MLWFWNISINLTHPLNCFILVLSGVSAVSDFGHG